jgi:hypothetical protein
MATVDPEAITAPKRSAKRSKGQSVVMGKRQDLTPELDDAVQVPHQAQQVGLPGVQHEVVVVIKSQVSRPSKRQDLTPKQTSKGKT